MIQLPPYEFTTGEEQQPIYDYTITLDDVEYRIKLRYRERIDRWYLSLYDADDVAIVLGVKLVVNTRLIEGYVMEGRPPGDFVLYDTSGAETECGFDDLGQRCALLYLDESELVAASDDYEITIEAVP